MNTPSHFLINAVLFKTLGRPQAPRSAFLWGSVAPDLPLVILTLGTVAYSGLLGLPLRGVMEQAFDQWYFTNPWWIASHNLLHSPVALVFFALVLWKDHARPQASGHWWLWFVFGCMVHSFLDVFTHHSDGPVVFWPLDWSMRFLSPVSYYEPQFYGQIFFAAEMALDVALLFILAVPVLKRLGRRK